jgi:TPP-dependent 2-oxoacid decarboxylase
MVEWLDRVVRKVITHEEPHPVGVPQNLATVTAEAHRLSFLFVRKSKSNSGPKEAIANLQNKIRTIRGQK